MKKITMIVLLIGMISCTSKNDFNKGKRQLEQMGYTNVVETGYNMFCCSNSDSFSTGFRCLDKSGNVVKGCFCSSIGKGLTIRFE